MDNDNWTLDGAEIHEHSLVTELRDGVERTILIIVTDVPLPPQTHIDVDTLEGAIADLVAEYQAKGHTINTVRLVHRGSLG